MQIRSAALAATLLIVWSMAAPTLGAAVEVNGIDLELPTGVSVSGRVTTPGGTPLADVIVGVCPSAFECFQIDALTDATGAYTIRGIVPGSYVVSAFPPDGTNLLQVYDGGDAGSVSDPALAVPIDLTAGGVSGIDLQFSPGLRIAGTVRDPDGNPVPGVHVSATGGPGNGSSIPSDAAGQFQAVGLIPGSYFLQVSPPGGSPFLSGYVADGSVQADFGGTQVVLEGADAAGVDFALARGRSISGHLDGAAGQLVDVFASGERSGPTTQVDSSGDFSTGPLWPGAYQLLFLPREIGDNEQFPYGIYNGDGAPLVSQNDPGVSVDVSSGDVTGLSAVLPDLPTMSGHISDASGPIPGASIQACSTAVGCALVQSGPDGAYSFLNLPDSAYVILAGARGHVASYYATAGPTPDPGQATPVVISGADVGGIDIGLPDGSSIAGKITGPAGEPVEGAFVLALPSSGGISFLGPGGAVTNAAGEYRLTGLADDEYRIQVNPPLHSAYLFGYWSAAGWTADFDAATRISIGSAPTIVSRSPEPDATGISRRAIVTVTFSADVHGVTRATFELREARTNRLLPGRVTYAPESRTATFIPAATLGRKTTYVVVVKAGIADAAGQPVTPTSWNFTTGT